MDSMAEQAGDGSFGAEVSSEPRSNAGYTTRPIRQAVTDLLQKEGGESAASVSLRKFSQRLTGWGYETLRKQLGNQRALQPQLIEAVANALGVQAEYFLEYRRHRVEQAIVANPEIVDLMYDLVISRARSLDAIAVPLVSMTLEQLAEGRDLSANRASKVLELIVNGQVGEGQAAAFFMGLRAKGETGEEISAFAHTLRSFTIPVVVPGTQPLVDIVSTGGSRLGAFNISTTSAFVAAAGGALVAKHGGRGQTSLVGSADLMQGLGARIDLQPEAISRCIQRTGMGFMLAALHCRPIRQILPLRRRLNMRTVFNFIPPMINPAGATRQLTGVSDTRYLEVVADALRRLGTEHSYVVRGDDGIDEISISGPTTVIEVKDGSVLPATRITPEDVGLQARPFAEVIGGDLKRNLSITQRVLSAEEGAPLDIVVLNAGVALYLASVTDSPREGVEWARETVKSGRAWDTMVDFVNYTRVAAGRQDQDDEIS